MNIDKDCYIKSYHFPGNNNVIGVDGVTKIHFPGRKQLDTLEINTESSLREHTIITPTSTNLL